MLKLIEEHFSSDTRDAMSPGIVIYRPEEIKALDRLMIRAEGHSLEAARCAVFLLSWHSPADIGGVDLSLLSWGLSAAVADDMSQVFCFMMRLQHLRLTMHSPQIDSKFRSLIAHWFPEVLGLEPKPPLGIALKGFRQRHDLTPRNVANHLRVPLSVVKSWEEDEHPMPIALWIELRSLMGERRSTLTVAGLAAEEVARAA